MVISMNIMMCQKPDNNSDLSGAYCVSGTVLSSLLVLAHLILMFSGSKYYYDLHSREKQTDAQNP